jgi:glycerol-3-phosphate dehydrogenase
MAEGSARHIVQTYGTRHVEIERRLARAGLAEPLAEGVPHLAAELVTAFDVEHAATLEDFMIRRSGLAYHPDNMRLAGAVAEKAIALGLLGEAAAEEQLDEFRETVEGPLRRA